LVEEAGGPRENHRPVASHWQTLSDMLYRVHDTVTIVSIVCFLILYLSLSL
jgi:hypothetical protein